ncbi:MAG: hypothetical protein KGJ23_01285 [Euryarchaeota archaeon]|nr:hypothetical protein [Euryarchaeota archaeon]MDE1835231.1 hypothetical protein [Euryarchaeota archaeon]MDE1881034.1 hypothetical protein [Euryarchaeota archaeon]MDE2043527.1 hypothetical protein [Thermoplasmata archaeon]
MPNFRRGRRGVAGFFEEIPAATVAIISLLLFFSGILVALSNYTNRQQSSQFAQEAQTFLEGLLGYSNLTYLGQNGIFDVYAMEALTVNNLTYDFHPSFQYSVTVTDTSVYPLHYNQNWATGTFPKDTSGLQHGWVSDSTPVDLWVFNFGDDEFHAASLTVVIWS